MKYLILFSLFCTTCIPQPPMDTDGREVMDSYWRTYCFKGRVFVETPTGLAQFLDVNGKPEICQPVMEK